MCLILKEGGPITGSESRVGLTSPHDLDTGGVEVRLISGEIILEAREEGGRRKEGVCQEDTSIKGVCFRNIFFSDTGKLNSRTSKGHYL